MGPNQSNAGTNENSHAGKPSASGTRQAESVKTYFPKMEHVSGMPTLGGSGKATQVQGNGN